MECVDNLCCLLKPKKWYLPFRGIPFIGLGDFCQVAPVVHGHGVTPLLLVSVQLFHLWVSFKILTLYQPHCSADNSEFTAFIDNIGKDYNHQQISLSILDHLQNDKDAISFLFPPIILDNSIASIKQALLSPINSYIDKFNDQILEGLPGETGEATTLS